MNIINHDDTAESCFEQHSLTGAKDTTNKLSDV